MRTLVARPEGIFAAGTESDNGRSAPRNEVPGFRYALNSLILSGINEKSQIGRRVSQGHLGDSCRISRKFISAPDHMEVGPYEDQIVFVNFARPLVRNLEHVQRGAQVVKRLLKDRGIGARFVHSKQRKSCPQPIMQRGAIGQPDVREPRAGPRRGHIKRVVGIWALARLGRRQDTVGRRALLRKSVWPGPDATARVRPRGVPELPLIF